MPFIQRVYLVDHFFFGTQSTWLIIGGKEELCLQVPSCLVHIKKAELGTNNGSRSFEVFCFPLFVSSVGTNYCLH